MFMKKIFVLLLSLVVYIPLVFAGDTVGTSSAIFLKKAVGARPAALGEAYTAVGGNPDAFFYNPASLGIQEKPSLSAMYQTGIADISMGSLIYAHPLGRWGTPAVGALYSDAGSIDVNVTGVTRQSKKAQQDTAYTIGYAVNLFDMVAIGIGGKQISSTLVEDYDDTTTSFDAGFLFTTPLKGLRIGGSALNMGKGLSYIKESDPLPKTYRGGISYLYEYFSQEENMYTFLITADGYKTLDEKSKGGVGIETTRNNFAIRFGYLLNRDIEGFTAGLGMKWNRYSVDYAFGFVEDLNFNHRVSFNVHFASFASRIEGKRQQYQKREKTLSSQ